jgi:hypothetical protein
VGVLLFLSPRFCLDFSGGSHISTAEALVRISSAGDGSQSHVAGAFFNQRRNHTYARLSYKDLQLISRLLPGGI